MPIRRVKELPNDPSSPVPMGSLHLTHKTGGGVAAVGANPWDAFEHIERVEHIAQIVLASGVRPDLLDADKKWWHGVRGTS